MRPALPLVLCALLACGSPEADRAGDVAAATTPLTPDTSTVDGMLVMRHGADAFKRAPQWTLEATPAVVYRDDANPDLDMTYVPGIQHPFLLPDGHMVAVPLVGRKGILLFGPDGQAERLLAPLGQGPGTVSPSHELTAFAVADTVLVLDPGNRRISRFTLASGLVGDDPWNIEPQARCRSPYGLLAGNTRYLVACAPEGADQRKDRPPAVYGLSDRLRRGTRVILELPGREHRETPTPAGRSSWQPVMFGVQSFIATWDTVIAYATQEHGFEIWLADTSGAPRARIVSDLLRRSTPPEAKEALIQRDLDAAEARSAHGGIPVSELQRRARVQPIADSLPWIGGLMVGADGVLWVMDPVTLTDTAWSATAFGPAGAIRGRLTGRGGWNEGPAWFGRGQVLIRRVDDDGVVRYELLGIRTEDVR